MDPTILASLEGYKAKTIDYKSTPDGEIKLDILYPADVAGTSVVSRKRTVLLHYHGGFLVLGDRYAFFPTWLAKAGASRGWIFVTPDYRLLPESTAQASVADARDAYEWILSSLGQELDCKIGAVLMAGSSAGGYLALTTAVEAKVQPTALLLIYGMLDPTSSRYTTPGTNIMGKPPFDTSEVLGKYPMHEEGDTRKAISGYPMGPNPADDPRGELVDALHVDALFLDYMTGIKGLGRLVAEEGPFGIPEEHRNLFPLAFADLLKLSKLPRTFLLHGRNDSFVGVENSLEANDKLQEAGVYRDLETPSDAEHGFDGKVGTIDIEATEGEKILGYESLRRALCFLDHAVFDRSGELGI